MYVLRLNSNTTSNQHSCTFNIFLLKDILTSIIYLLSKNWVNGVRFVVVSVTDLLVTEDEFYVRIRLPTKITIESSLT